VTKIATTALRQNSRSRATLRGRVAAGDSRAIAAAVYSEVMARPERGRRPPAQRGCGDCRAPRDSASCWSRERRAAPGYSCAKHTLLFRQPRCNVGFHKRALDGFQRRVIAFSGEEQMSTSSEESPADVAAEFRSLTHNEVLVGSEEIFKPSLRHMLVQMTKEPGAEKTLPAHILEHASKEVRLRIGTLLKVDNVSFLLGAGCSLDAGGVSLARIPAEVERDLLLSGLGEKEPAPWLQRFYEIVAAVAGWSAPADLKKRAELLAEVLTPDGTGNARSAPSRAEREIPINLENFLLKMHTWRSSMLGSAVKVQLGEKHELVLADVELQTIISRLTSALVKTCALPRPGKEQALETPCKMLKKTLTRPLNLRRVNFFTLNYDTLVEQAADAEGVVVLDGFVGTLKRVFRPECYNHDLYFPAQTTEGRVHRLDRVVHLYKLHGSITWQSEDPSWQNPYGVFSAHPVSGSAHPVVIYPSPLKYGEALGLPYSELFRRFAHCVAQTQSVLVVVGYSFGDDHVTAIIRQALTIPSFTLVIVDPEPASEFVRRLRAQQDQRVWIVSGPDLGTFRGFVEYLLPDLREEEILKNVVATYRALSVREGDAEGKEEGNVQ